MGEHSHRDERNQPPCRLRALQGGAAPVTPAEVALLVSDCEGHRAELEASNKELRDIQQQLQRYRDRYVDLYDFAPLGYVTLDEDGYVQEINLAGAKMLGAERESLIGYPLADFVAEGDKTAFLEHVERCSRRRQELTTEINLVAKDGRALTVQLHSLPIDESDPNSAFCKTAITDISERHRAEASCREAETRLRLALTAAELGTWQWDLAADRLTADARGNALMGLPHEAEMNRELLFKIIHPDDQRAVVERLAEAVAAPGEYESEFRAVWPDGSIHWVYVKGRSTRDGAQQVHLTGVSMDITDRKDAEARLVAATASAERAKAAAESASRAKDHFLAVLSHELRAPLTPVVLGVSLLLDRYELIPAARETVEMIGRNVDMEARLIDDLLDLSRIARGKIDLQKQRVELHAIVQQAIDVCMSEIEARRMNFTVALDPDSACWIEADAARLQQVFWNLLKNAIKFTPQGGCIGVRCQPDENFVAVEVSDSGIGIEPEALTRVFNAFEQAERSITRQFGGLGLGLAISKALVEMHGGTIEALSEGRSKGATFRVRLPLAGSDSRSPRPVSTALRERPIPPLRILLVEDHAVTAKVLRLILNAQGHSVETAGDVVTALKLAGEKEFDLLMSDLGLPDGSGHDLLRELRARGHKFLAIALSGYGRKEDVERSYQAGFAAHLTKPASRESIVAAVGYVMTMEKPGS